MEVDTGASVSTISEETLANTFHDFHLQPAPNIYNTSKLQSTTLIYIRTASCISASRQPNCHPTLDSSQRTRPEPSWSQLSTQNQVGLEKYPS